MRYDVSAAELELVCKFSASNNISVTWLKDDKQIDDMDKYTTLHEVEQGDFSYGLKQAVRYSMAWGQRPEDWSCKSVDFYSGQYQCQATAMAADVEKFAESSGVEVKILRKLFY